MTKDSEDDWGEIRICESFAKRVWPEVPTDSTEDFAYDRCGFSIWTAGVNPSMVCMDSDGAATEAATKTACEADPNNKWVMNPVSGWYRTASCGHHRAVVLRC